MIAIVIVIVVVIDTNWRWWLIAAIRVRITYSGGELWYGLGGLWLVRISIVDIWWAVTVDIIAVAVVVNTIIGLEVSVNHPGLVMGKWAAVVLGIYMMLLVTHVAGHCLVVYAVVFEKTPFVDTVVAIVMVIVVVTMIIINIMLWHTMMRGVNLFYPFLHFGILLQ